MAIKKCIIDQHEWQYALVTQHDGSIAVIVTTPDDSTQSLTVTDVQFNAAKSSIQFICNGRYFSMQIVQNGSKENEQIIHFAHGKTIKVKPISGRPIEPLFLPANQEAPSLTQTTNLMTVKSPLAGRVTKVLVNIEQPVLKGQPLLLIESMKMENEICAPAFGNIKMIAVGQGEIVKPNQILLELS